MAAPDNETRSVFEEGTLLWGMILGLLTGIIVAVFKVPRSGIATRRKLEHSLRSKLESVAPGDPIAESLAEGKIAARRRQTELDSNPSD